jgi:hypothetical protein
MSTSLLRRLEELEEERARELASRVKWQLVWIDPVTGERTDSTEK